VHQNGASFSPLRSSPLRSLRFASEWTILKSRGSSRMRLNLRPAKGWRAFAGEVGVIVLGVLIALAAQQAAESVNERREATETRARVVGEIEESLTILELRKSVQPGGCGTCGRWSMNGAARAVSRRRDGWGRHLGSLAAACGWKRRNPPGGWPC
jgi:hypothetical protein